MGNTCPIIVVSGFLGAGKTRLIQTLAESSRISTDPDSPDGDAEAAVVEVHGLRHPCAEVARLSGPCDMRIVTVVDAVNLVACLGDDASVNLVTKQILAADCMMLARTDIVDPSEARAKVATITHAPVFDITTTPAMLPALLKTRKTSPIAETSTVPNLSEGYATWSYAGSSILTPEALDGFVAAVRALGAYRVFGRVICPLKGIAIEVAGRMRQTAGILSPTETTLTVIGAKPAFSVRSAELAFVEAVMDASYSVGNIACR